MTEIITLTDADWKESINGSAAILLLSNGEGVRSDFTSSFKKAAAENNKIIFAEVRTDKNPEVAAFFEAGEKPLMIGWYNGEAKIRRNRPWGSDIVLAVEELKQMVAEDATEEELEELLEEEQGLVESEPVHVTDATFQADVVEYSKTVPVLVDFWAEWCGPCRQVAPILDKLAGEFAGQVRVAKVDVDQNPALSQAFRIQSIPTIMAFKAGQPVFSQPGAFPEPAFRDLIQQLIALEIPEEAV